MQEKIQRFTDLVAWKEGHQVVLFIYKVTESFPKVESFRLTDQMCRSASSITANIAEGFSRKSKLEKIHFYFISLGSATETQNHLILAKDLGYLDNDVYAQLEHKLSLIHKLINGLIRSAETKS